jgi:hypothetical protein
MSLEISMCLVFTIHVYTHTEVIGDDADEGDGVDNIDIEGDTDYDDDDGACKSHS